MKKYLICLCVVAFAFTGCGDWFDVSSRFETKEDDLYNSEEGFKSALTGVYIKMAEKSLYGINTSMLVPDCITRHWELPSFIDQTTTQYGLYQHDYTVTKTEETLKAVWQGYYNAILQVNSVIENIEKTEIPFSHGNDKLIRGEAYGLRAFLHLDLLRFFGPVPRLATDGTLAIPYMEEVTRDPNAMVSLNWSQVRSKILRDLEKAEELLEDDPFTIGSYKDLNFVTTVPEYSVADQWQAYRQMRFNYYAVKAIKARAYLWFQDAENAVVNAKEVIEAQNRDGSLKFDLATETYFNGFNSSYLTRGRTLIMDCENIFQVHNSKHQEVLEKEKIFKGNPPNLTLSLTNLEKLYEADLNRNDIRVFPGRLWMNVQEGGNTVTQYLKYIGNTDIAAVNRIPVIRLSELYLILVECLPLGEANKYLEEYRIARKLERDFTENPFDETERMSLLESEYRKDFMAEGQMFHYYKRVNSPTFNWPEPVEVDQKVYVLPMPKGQIEFE